MSEIETVNPLKNLFENHEGWLVTTNGDDGCKIARLDDKSNIIGDWIKVKPEDTSIIINKSDLSKVVKFFIGDLLRAEKRDKYFVYKNLLFVKVFICGNLIAVYPHKEKLCLIVDDGTSNITCYLEKNEMLDQLKTDITQGKDRLHTLLSENKDDAQTKVLYLMRRNAWRNIRQIPSFEDLRVGDCVSFIGAMREYNDERYVFIHKIIKHDENGGCAQFSRHLREMTTLYENVYQDS